MELKGMEVMENREPILVYDKKLSIYAILRSLVLEKASFSRKNRRLLSAGLHVCYA